MSDHDAKVEDVPPPREEILEPGHYHEDIVDNEGDIAAAADGEHDSPEVHRRLSDPQGKLRGKSDKPVIKSTGGGGSSKPGGVKKDESESDKSPEGPDESQGWTTEQPTPAPSAAVAPPKKKGKLRGKAAPSASKGNGGKGTGGLPGGAKT